MMKAANSGQSNDLGLGGRSVLGWPIHRGIPQPRVDSVGVVVVDILAEKTPQVLLVQNDHVIEKLPANAADRTGPILRTHKGP